jgi:hypothetical protein
MNTSGSKLKSVIRPFVVLLIALLHLRGKRLLVKRLFLSTRYVVLFGQMCIVPYMPSYRIEDLLVLACQPSVDINISLESQFEWRPSSGLVWFSCRDSTNPLLFH